MNAGELVEFFKKLDPKAEVITLNPETKRWETFKAPYICEYNWLKDKIIMETIAVVEDTISE